MIKVHKIIVTMKTDGDDISEVAIVLMRNKDVMRIVMLGKDYDENDEDLPSKILNEETDSRFVDEDTVMIAVRNISGTDNYIKEVSEVIEELADTVVEDGFDIDYVIYNSQLSKDNPVTVEDFGNDLIEYMTDVNEELTPVDFTSIFVTPGSQYLEDILGKYDIKDHSFSSESVLSGAIWTSLVLDASMGRY